MLVAKQVYKKESTKYHQLKTFVFKCAFVEILHIAKANITYIIRI